MKDFPSLGECECTSAEETETEESIQKLETDLGTELPEDYKEFLKRIGSCKLNGWIACDCPTPFGLHN